MTTPQVAEGTAGDKASVGDATEEIAAAGLREIQLAFEKAVRSLDAISQSWAKSARETLEFKPASLTERSAALDSDAFRAA